MCSLPDSPAKATATQCTYVPVQAPAVPVQPGGFACGGNAQSARIATSSDRSRVYELNTLAGPDACVSGSE